MKSVVFGLGFQGLADAAIVQGSMSYRNQQKRDGARDEAQKHVILDDQEHGGDPQKAAESVDEEILSLASAHVYPRSVRSSPSAKQRHKRKYILVAVHSSVCAQERLAMPIIHLVIPRLANPMPYNDQMTTELVTGSRVVFDLSPRGVNSEGVSGLGCRMACMTNSCVPAEQASNTGDEGHPYNDWAKELLADWDGYQSRMERFRMRRRNRPSHEAQFTLVYGLVCQAHESARGYLAILGAVPSMVATPMLRACYEQAITAHWVAQVDDAYQAVGQEYVRQRRNLATGLRESAVGALQGAAREVEAVVQFDVNELETLSASPARHFDRLCADLVPGGKEAYSYYRVMSMESHASVLVADQWLSAPEGVDGPVLLNPKQRMRSEEPWLYLLAASLIWAGRALDFFDETHSRRSYLRTMANEIGVAQELKLSGTHFLRMREEKQKAKRKAAASSPTPSQ